MVTKAVILAAGKGTRFLPATLGVPKEMFPILNKPALMYHLKECVNAGITDVMVVISNSKKSMLKFIQPNFKDLDELIKAGKQEYLEEYMQIMSKLNITVGYSNKALGSAYATLTAKKWSKGQPYVLISGDDIIDAKPAAAKQLIDVYEQSGRPVVAFQQVPHEEMYKYGAADIAEQQGSMLKLRGIIEKPPKGTEPSNYAVIGRYIITPKVYDEIAKLTPKNGEYCLTDALNVLAVNGECMGRVVDGIYYDCGSKLGFAKCTIDRALKEIDGTELTEWLTARLAQEQSSSEKQQQSSVADSPKKENYPKQKSSAASPANNGEELQK